ncbi:glutamate-cysteine ligase family protein [Kitasatospora aburaviensis]
MVALAHRRTAPVLDEAQYEALADALVECGVLLDRRMIYWYARPSEHVPTLEVRIADVNADLDTVLLLAGLLRGLAAVLLDEIRAGRPAPALPTAWSAPPTGRPRGPVSPGTGSIRAPAGTHRWPSWPTGSWSAPPRAGRGRRPGHRGVRPRPPARPRHRRRPPAAGPPAPRSPVRRGRPPRRTHRRRALTGAGH